MVLAVGGLGHQLITTYAVNQAFAQHTAEASDLHPNKAEVNRRLDKLEEQQIEQQKTNSQVIRSLAD